jgi:hypothetical protein
MFRLHALEIVLEVPRGGPCALILNGGSTEARKLADPSAVCAAGAAMAMTNRDRKGQGHQVVETSPDRFRLERQSRAR